MELKGIIKAVSQKEKNYGVNVNDTWLNDFGTCPVKKGNNVLIEYEISGNFKNIKKISVVAGEVGGDVIKPEEFGKGRKEYDKDPVGLAVELYCSNKEDTMADCIDAVKQAQKAFS